MELVDEREAQGVELVGPVQGDDRDVGARAVDEDERVGGQVLRGSVTGHGRRRLELSGRARRQRVRPSRSRRFAGRAKVWMPTVKSSP